MYLWWGGAISPTAYQEGFNAHFFQCLTPLHCWTYLSQAQSSDYPTLFIVIHTLAKDLKNHTWSADDAKLSPAEIGYNTTKDGRTFGGTKIATRLWRSWRGRKQISSRSRGWRRHATCCMFILTSVISISFSIIILLDLFNPESTSADSFTIWLRSGTTRSSHTPLFHQLKTHILLFSPADMWGYLKLGRKGRELSASVVLKHV